jgi:hypothetical protein
MPISTIEFNDDFAQWRDSFNEAINQLNAATDQNVAETLVKRDASGNITVQSVVQESTLASKENIQDMNNAMALIRQFKPILYDSKKVSKDKNVPGLIAEDVNQIYPELTESKKDELTGVHYTRLIPILIKGIQEMDKKVERLWRM